MSYILDALRRADAERDRGNVPGIHAQPGYGAPVPGSAAPAPKPWPWLIAGAAAVTLVAALAWYLLAPAGRGAVEVAASLPAAPAATVAPVAAPLPAPVPTPPPAATVLPPMPAPRAEPPPAPRQAKPVAVPAETPPAATAEKVYTLNELPEDIRRQLPRLTVGGSMYSGKPADRLLILNGQVAHEGDRIGNDLVLQQIRLKNAVLSFKGYRYTLDF